jgi:hypothetical protein
MILITDANIIFSALLKPNSLIAQIIKEEQKFQFFAPDYLLEEFRVHQKRIEEMSPYTQREFREEWSLIRSRIKIIDSTTISNEIFAKSFEIVKDIDEWDIYFVALHFKTGHKIWTGDKELIKGLKAKGYNICITTEELKDKLYKKER